MRDHLEDCEENFLWENTEMRLKREVPPAPNNLWRVLGESQSDPHIVEKINEEALLLYEQYSLMKCKICDQQFSPYAFNSHFEKCKKKRERAEKSKEWAKEGGDWQNGMRPAGLFCYICGWEYFSKSLAIHIPQCKEKWVKTESMKPKNERRPIPEPPMDLDKAIKSG